MHVLLTSERDGYYVDYADRPLDQLGRVLTQGFAYQGEIFSFSGKARGEPSADLSPAAFVNFLQNHDQVGNRAFGERLAHLAPVERIHFAVAVTLLAPQIPLIFMGGEYAASQPFLYFCDYQGALADAVRTGRRAEFQRFSAFADPAVRETIPDPNSPDAFIRSRLDWSERKRPPHAQMLEYVRGLLRIRREHIAPRIAEFVPGAAEHCVQGKALTVHWPLHSGAAVAMQMNVSDAPAPVASTSGRLLHSTRSASDPGACGRLGGALAVRALMTSPAELSSIAASGPIAGAPRATYRVQLNREFTFNDAARIVPYLARLGISHLYTSPILKARPGSMHGYDVTDHTRLNPELGERGGLRSARRDAARSRHGADRRHRARIIWASWAMTTSGGSMCSRTVPRRAARRTSTSTGDPYGLRMRNRILVPVLGAPYGEVLERGELKVEFDAAAGAFAVRYFEHRMPIDPREYPRIFAARSIDAVECCRSTIRIAPTSKVS